MGVIFITSNLAWLQFDILPLSGFQGNRARKLTKGQILTRSRKGLNNPLPTTCKLLAVKEIIILKFQSRLYSVTSQWQRQCCVFPKLHVLFLLGTVQLYFPDALAGKCKVVTNSGLWTKGRSDTDHFQAKPIRTLWKLHTLLFHHMLMRCNGSVWDFSALGKGGPTQSQEPGCLNDHVWHRRPTADTHWMWYKLEIHDRQEKERTNLSVFWIPLLLPSPPPPHPKVNR